VIEYRTTTSDDGGDGPAALRNALERSVLPSDLARRLTDEERTDLVAEYTRAHPLGTPLRGCCSTGGWRGLKPQ
jgi:hypothetical protein